MHGKSITHGESMRYLLVAGAGLVAGVLLAGVPDQALLPLLLLLACPLMMVVMMLVMGGHGGGHSHDTAPPERTDNTMDRAAR